MYSLNKTKTRTRLYVKSVNYLIGTKELIRNLPVMSGLEQKILTSVRNWKQVENMEMDDNEFEKIVLSTEQSAIFESINFF